MNKVNPFALIKASDISYEQINSLWVSVGDAAIDEIIEPRSRVSKFVLGGKGTGKTHILRYFSYQALCLRHQGQSGIAVLRRNRFLAVFLRANGLDASRFESPTDTKEKWQAAFAFYFEIRLVEAALEVLALVRANSPSEDFDDVRFLDQLKPHITDPVALNCATFDEFRKWISSERRKIDQAVNNAAFSGKLEISVPFSLGEISLNIGAYLGSWHHELGNLPFIYLVDEIENFSAAQQKVVNALIRYGEGRATFRVGGRLYAVKTYGTLSNGEENREGAEFKTVFLDNILRDYKHYPRFAKEFIVKRLAAAGLGQDVLKDNEGFDPKKLFLDVESRGYYSDFILELFGSLNDLPYERSFHDTLRSVVRPSRLTEREINAIMSELLSDFPILIRKLNILRFVKRARGSDNLVAVATSIATDAQKFLRGEDTHTHSYRNAYGHYSGDLLAQLCREAKRPGGVPYAGFETFVKMSSGNPRNLLVLLGKIYQILAFKEEGFFDGKPATIDVQTTAASEAAKFMFEQDTNFGTASDLARDAVSRLATLLRAARYALNIPEVSPLAVSFEEGVMSEQARATLRHALHFSFLFEIDDGRPDRNSEAVNRKVQLNPMLSPRWGLPLGRRGDLKLGTDLLNAIFERERGDEFKFLLKRLETKWNNPFSRQRDSGPRQEELFPHD
ncbi:hypothetical protein [Burkholderia vietnamiensis]|uniref:ORC-CDC6 family AAA ATPase n=1 Tax=Burkholderia vietnamiensis TaxID=60552 RepID=UPI0009BEA675|nr:hypothetical protein [Burkholderia vietnamiensis]